MSRDNLEQFIQHISDSEELQAKIGDEIATDAFVALGAEHGCEFTEEDLQASAELSDGELDGVAGGMLSVPNNVASYKGSGGGYRIECKVPTGGGVRRIGFVIGQPGFPAGSPGSG